jgi:hypothetical protein
MGMTVVGAPEVLRRPAAAAGHAEGGVPSPP